MGYEVFLPVRFFCTFTPSKDPIIIFESMSFKQIPSETILFLMLYGGTAMAALIACIYLLLRKCNAIAADVTPPLSLRRWAAGFFAIMFLGHIWWLLFYLFSDDFHSVSYVALGVLDGVALLTTIAGTLFAMLQDRKRSVWPIVVATLPYVVFGGLYLAYPSGPFLLIAVAYIVLLCVLFIIYMIFAVRRYRRWLRDNYADLEHKDVWLSNLLIIATMLLIIIYGFDVGDIIISYVVQVIELALFFLLLWRVETLEQLDEATTQAQDVEETPVVTDEDASSALSSGIGPLLERHCEEAQLYLQHDLSLAQLSQAIGTNHFYLSQYFTQQGRTYNTYINDLRINHFVNLYHEAVATQRSFTAQQLANESGFRSYSTFSAAFKQRMGQTVSAWMHDAANGEK